MTIYTFLLSICALLFAQLYCNTTIATSVNKGDDDASFIVADIRGQPTYNARVVASAITSHEPSTYFQEVSAEGNVDASSVGETFSVWDGDLVPALDSDYFFLDVQSSKLQHANSSLAGVFATLRIYAGSVICEYRGNVIRAIDLPLIRIDGTRTGTMDLIGLDGEHYIIMGDNICSLILDCTAVAHRSFSKSEFDALERGEQQHLLDCLPPFQHNAYFTRESGKLFVAALRDILPGEEIFVNYGW